MATRLSGYQSDDEYSNRKLYSREDFKEIYCINEKSVEGLEKSRSTGFLFLGCLSSYQESPCRRYNRSTSTENSIFTSCYSNERRFTNSEEELRPRYVYYYHEPLYQSSSAGSCVVRGDRPRSVATDSVSRESLYNEAKRFTWNEQMEKYIESKTFQQPQTYNMQKQKCHRYPSAPLHNISTKHVSFYSPTEALFSRSATSTSFDEHKMRRARFELMNGGVSQERLIDGRKTPELKSGSQLGSNVSLSRLVKNATTQTENFIVRAGGASEFLCLSPRTQMRSRMISQPTQTNGVVMATPVLEKKEELEKIEQTEEEFHENLLNLFSPTQTQTPSSNMTTVVSRSPSNKSIKSETSSSGSYSLENRKQDLIKIEPLIVDVIEPIIDEIIKPPEGFGDNGDNFKKFIKKKKSLRAKSEERERYKQDAATQSSISLHASLHDLTTLDDDDSGIYLEPYTSGIWVYIGETEEVNCWTRHEPLSRVASNDSTNSEKEFCKKFVALTHRMVHRKASGECYRRLAAGCLEINKRITLSRITTTGEYGFRIHGSRPVVVSAVEALSPAEQSGLEVGDVIIQINGLHVLDSSHSDVVRIASTAEALELELARTLDVINGCQDDDVIYEGELEKFNETNGNWIKRHFRLKQTDLYYSKSQQSPPLAVLSLIKPNPITITMTTIEFKQCIVLKRGQTSLLLSSDDDEELSTWFELIQRVVDKSVQDDKWIAESGKYVSMAPGCVVRPDCVGPLWKLGRRIKSWGRKFCILKDACLYFYLFEGETSAVGAAHLHGYRVQTVSILGGKRYAFELIPPDNSMRHYYLSSESDNDRKRWLAALEYSIDRWLNLSNTLPKLKF